jgi:hypothetical protein
MGQIPLSSNRAAALPRFHGEDAEVLLRFDEQALLVLLGELTGGTDDLMSASLWASSATLQVQHQELGPNARRWRALTLLGRAGLVGAARASTRGGTLSAAEIAMLMG